MNNYIKLLSIVGTLVFSIQLSLQAKETSMDIKHFRKTDYLIHDLFLNRWSPRAMSGKAITDKELFTLFEAARWSPSEYNNQPWRFIYAKQGTEHWQTLFDLLVPFNKQWCNNAAALVVIISKRTLHGNKLSRTHSFDTGAAWQNIALQGAHMGLVVHGMSGFSFEKAKKELNVPEEYNVEAMFAVGYPGNIDALPEDMRKGDKEPSGRKPLDELVFEGSFLP